MRILGISLVSTAIVIAAACGGGATDSTTNGGQNPGTGTNPSTNPNTVALVDSSFNPAAITVKAGTTVTWQWSACADTSSGYGYGSGACMTHQISFDDGSGVQSPKQDQGSFNRTFASAGTFKYHCLIHGSYMSGQVTVQ